MHIPSKDELLYYTQEVLGVVAVRLLAVAGKISAHRGDMHEFAHIIAAIMSGNSSECRYDLSLCVLFDNEDERFIEDFSNVEPMGSIEDLWLDGID